MPVYTPKDPALATRQYSQQVLAKVMLRHHISPIACDSVMIFDDHNTHDCWAIDNRSRLFMIILLPDDDDNDDDAVDNDDDDYDDDSNFHAIHTVCGECA